MKDAPQLPGPLGPNSPAPGEIHLELGRQESVDPRLQTFQVVCGSDGCAVVESVKFSRQRALITKKVMEKKGEDAVPKMAIKN